jgi:hypothetical protein
MRASEKIAIAAHLHVLLRRKTGRVTDTEWMANNRDYAMEIVRFARQYAAEQGDADLSNLANKLADIMAPAIASPAPGAALGARQSRPAFESSFVDSVMDKDFSDSKPVRERKASEAPRYVAGLR